ncbi:MAG: hypothetical protein BWY15_01676 [Firmicutes bacterium ADurb.Bin193]|nr:MAG: hypothetical protein BWY15_01676 [Firmicutes bacterium ADurb.Bin193]
MAPATTVLLELYGFMTLPKYNMKAINMTYEIK